MTLGERLLYIRPMSKEILRFQFSEKKGIEALTYIASKWEDVSAFYAAKILYFAEKQHLNKYARPIVADTFVAMPYGPVPSTLYDFIKGELSMAENPAALQSALQISGSGSGTRALRARREADVEALSESDIECLDFALEHCRHRGFGLLSQLTHQEKAWSEAPQNGPMNYSDMIDDDNPRRTEILNEAKEFAAYGVM